VDKKIIRLLISLVVLSVLAIFLIFKGTPSVKTVQPLEKTDVSTMVKVVIDQPDSSYTLEKKNDQWMIVSPLVDVADPQNMTRLLEMLHNFSVGSIISESPSRYDNFHVSSGTAVRVRVYVQGAEAPVLDGYMGKEATTPRECYFRFEGKTPVYIAADMRTYVLREPVHDYRMRKFLPIPVTTASKVFINTEKSSLDVSRSSATWTNNVTQQEIPADWVQGLLGKLDAFQVSDFGIGNEPAAAIGFTKPILNVMVETSSGSAKALVGALLPKQNNQPSTTRYALLEGRQAILIVADATVQEILTLLKSQPK
jgi:Domain of unknown function (DUF4340)